MKAADVYSVILKYGFFPDRVCGMLSSENFGEWVIKNDAFIQSLDKNKVFKIQNYKATRNNNAPRYFGLIHPEAYCRLSYCIRTNWSKIFPTISSFSAYESTSMIRPSLSNKDRRLFSMKSYDKPENEYDLLLDKQMGAKFVVKLDIASCFPSIYTHSIPWALVGKDVSKANNDQNEWFERLDSACRKAQDKETIGLPIGSDTSNLFAEIILVQIDKLLTKKYKYIRFIDDYTCYCKDTSEAEEFIADLSRELEKFRLKLNVKKSKIVTLPSPINESWVRQLRQLSKKGELKRGQKNDVIDFLDLASELFKKNPNESPIRYAVTVLSKKNIKDFITYKLILNYILNLCVLYPYIIDQLGDLILKGVHDFKIRRKDILDSVEVILNQIIDEHILFARTDAIAWSFNYAIIYSLKINNSEKVMEIAQDQEDYTMLLMLYLYSKKNSLNMDFDSIIKRIANMSDKEATEAWLFEYEYCRIENKPFLDNPFLEKIRNDRVSFLDKSLLGVL